MKTIIDARTLALAAVALAAVAAASCTKDSGGAAPAADDNGGVTTASPGGSTPASPAAVAPAAEAPKPTMPLAAASEWAPPGESPTTQPSQAASTTEVELTAAMSGLDGAKVRFVDCAGGASCSARLEAPTLASLRDLLARVSAQRGGIGFVAREQLDGYAGRTFVADVTLGGAEARPVPADENELLTN
jgi:hypothetical protein